MIEATEQSKEKENSERGKRIAYAIDLIKKKGKKQKEIAEVLNVSPQAVNNWKRTGKASIDGLMLLADMSGLSLNYLRYGTESAPTNHSETTPNKSSPISRQPSLVAVKSFEQIINSDKGSLREMPFTKEVFENSVFYEVDTDLMEGDQGAWLPKGMVAHVLEGEQPEPGDVALYEINGSPAMGHFSVVAGTPYVRPSNSQYQSINVEPGRLVGVIYRGYSEAIFKEFK